MADNYLERQRDLYEARKAAWEKQKKYGKKKHAVHPCRQKATIKTKDSTPQPSLLDRNK